MRKSIPYEQALEEFKEGEYQILPESEFSLYYKLPNGHATGVSVENLLDPLFCKIIKVEYDVSSVFVGPNISFKISNLYRLDKVHAEVNPIGSYDRPTKWRLDVALDSRSRDDLMEIVVELHSDIHKDSYRIKNFDMIPYDSSSMNNPDVDVDIAIEELF